MGRIKSVAIKNLGEALLTEHTERFTADFERNKQVVNEVRPIKSKKVRNVVAGYITKKVKALEKNRAGSPPVPGTGKTDIKQ